MVKSNFQVPLCENNWDIVRHTLSLIADMVIFESKFLTPKNEVGYGYVTI